MDWSSCQIQGVAQLQCLQAVFKNIITAVASLAVIVFMIMLIMGGFKYLTSSGDAKKTEQAKGALTAAFLGLILIISGYIILRLIEYVTGIPVTVFSIPTK